MSAKEKIEKDRLESPSNESGLGDSGGATPKSGNQEQAELVNKNIITFQHLFFQQTLIVRRQLKKYFFNCVSVVAARHHTSNTVQISFE